MSTEAEVGSAPTALDDGHPGSTIPQDRRVPARPHEKPADLPAPTAPVARPAEPAPPAQPAVDTGPDSESSPNWLVPLLVLVVGMFMSVLDISIVNVAISTMQNDFGATTDQIQWVSTSYSLAEGVIVPASAWIGARLGLGRTYIFAMIGFAVFSAFCGLAWDVNSMIVFRILQAIPGGIIPVVALSMLYKIVPKKSIGAAMGIYGLGIVFAPAIGPTFGGYLVEYVDWRLIFFINVPVAVLGVVAAFFLLPKFRPEVSRKFDLPGFAAIAVGAFSLLLALSEAPTWGWTSYPTLILITLGVLALALFVVIELEVDAPLLDVRVFRSWAFSNSLILIAIVSVGLFGVLFYIPVYLQQFQDMGAFDTGLLLLPQALVMAVIMPLAGTDLRPLRPAMARRDRPGGGRLHHLGHGEPDHGHPARPAAADPRRPGRGHRSRDDADHDRRPVLAARRAHVHGQRLQHRRPAHLVGHRTGGHDRADDPAAGPGARGPRGIMPSSGSSGSASSSSASSSAASSGSMSSGSASAGSAASSGSGSGGGSMLEQYSNYQHLQSQVFITGLNDLLIATAILTAIGVPLALTLRSGKPKAEEGPRVIEG